MIMALDREFPEKEFPELWGATKLKGMDEQVNKHSHECPYCEAGLK